MSLGPLVTLNIASHIQVACVELKLVEEVEWIAMDQLAP